MMIVILSVYVISIVCSGHRSNEVTVDDINMLRMHLREEYNISSGLLACTVRLSFHDCSGPGEAKSTEIAQCNGCVDFQNPDHAGLVSGCVEPLQQIYLSGWHGIMSRADFWAAAATIALEYAQQLDLVNVDDRLREIPYYFGRTDCGDDAGDAVDTKHFVGAHLGWSGVLLWFYENLDWTEQQIVAIIGAHTLGMTHSYASGFSTLKWVRNLQILDNHFYIDLHGGEKGVYSNGWEQHKAPNNSFYEWHNPQHAFPYIMLNSDMGLWYDIDSHLEAPLTGEVDCDYSNCGVSPVRHITQMYVDSNQKWLDDFADIFEIMIQTGYTKLQSLSCGNGRGTENSESEDSGSTESGDSGSSESGSSSSDDASSSSEDRAYGGHGGRGGGYGGHDMSIGYHTYGIDNDGDTYYWRIMAMYPAMFGILLVILLINTFILCQIKLRGNRYNGLGIEPSKYESVSHDDSEEIQIAS